jgi:hypothetical protein
VTAHRMEFAMNTASWFDRVAFHPNYLLAALHTEYRRVANAAPKSLNDTLNRAAFGLGQLPIDDADIFRTLEAAAHQRGFRDNLTQLRATIQSGINGGRQSPRQATGQPGYRPIKRDYVAAALDDWLTRKPTFPQRTCLGGQWSEKFSDEIRRHYYRQAGVAVHAKIKLRDGWVAWYRVKDGWQPKKPADYVAIPYIGAINPFDPELTGDIIYWPEGERDVDSLSQQNLPAFTFGGTSALPDGVEQYVSDRDVVVLADNDLDGKRHAEKKVACCRRVAKSVKLVEFSELRVGGDVTDWLAAGHSFDEFIHRVDETEYCAVQGRRPEKTDPERPDREGASSRSDWPDPHPLPSTLLPVEGFDFDLLPDNLRAWCADVSERIQCPADFVGVSLMAAAGSMIGRKVGIRPKDKDDWTVVANQWAFLIGRPGILKSPAMEEALRPLKRLSVEAEAKFKTAQANYQATAKAAKLRADVAHKEAAKQLAKDALADVSNLLKIVPQEEQPMLKRYIANDTNVASLGVLLQQNPNGLLVFRDELVSLLDALDREENIAERGFYLTGWQGDSRYTFDRIGRGLHLSIEGICLSMLGSTQPGRIAQYLSSAVRGGRGDDGLIQRFGLLVWPEVSGEWQNVDRWPDKEARDSAFVVFDRLDKLDWRAIGAKRDMGAGGEEEGLPYLRFGSDGHDIFADWRANLERRLRTEELHPALESHLAKYRKLVPGLSLICHLADGGTGPVGVVSIKRGIAWAKYLESHGRRAYGSATAAEADTAKLILSKIKAGQLNAAGFSSREVWRPGWSRLTDREAVKAGLAMLVEYDHLTARRVETEGRTAVVYAANPKALKI